MHTVTGLASRLCTSCYVYWWWWVGGGMHSQAVKIAWQHSITSTTP